MVFHKKSKSTVIPHSDTESTGRQGAILSKSYRLTSY